MNVNTDLPDLVERLKNSDPEAFKELYVYYFPRLYGFARKILFARKDQVEDVIQEVFIKVWNERENIRGSDTFNAYLHTITRNIIYNELKKQSRIILEAHNELSQIEMSGGTDVQNPYSGSDFRDYVAHLLKMLNDLPEQQRKVFTKIHIEGKSAKETAEELNISHRTVEGHLQLANQKIRSRFQEALLTISMVYVTKTLIELPDHVVSQVLVV